MKYEANRIYSTTDYSIFKKLEQNRSVTEARKEKIKKSMEQIKLRSPIKVNENMEIIDGQGRAAALMELGMPIEFFVAAGEGIQECVQQNKVNSRWSTMDFIDSYADGGNINYINLKRLISAFPAFPPSVIIDTVTVGKGNGVSYSDLNSGKLRLDGERLVKAQRDMDILKRFEGAYKIMRGHKKYMMTAIIKAVGYGMDPDILAEKMIQQPGKIYCADIRTDLIGLEDIYNKGLRADARRYVVAEYDKEKAGAK